MRYKFVNIFVVLTAIALLTSCCQLNKIKPVQIQNHSKDANPEIWSNESFSHIENFLDCKTPIKQSNEHIYIILNSGLSLMLAFQQYLKQRHILH